MTNKELKLKVAHKRKLIHNPNVLIVLFALFAALGYLGGVYHYQIIALIGPVFGHKSYSANIDFSNLQDTYSKLAANYDGNLDKNLLVEGANRGMVAAAGDDYTKYMSATEAEEFSNDLSGNIGGGIGAEIGKKNEKVIVVRALKDNPAEKAGLNANDIILSVNDQSTDGWTVDQAVSQIRGEVGTTVKIIIQRGSEIKDFTITRATISSPSVESVVKDGIGILTLTRFDEQTGSLARTAATDFVKQSVKGVILDLRGNGGGFVSAARDVAGLWLNNQVIVVEKSGNTTRDSLKSANSAVLGGIPTVILVNGSSASASEIVAGALQDYKVASLVGEKTFGKGSVQQIFDLAGGAIVKVTVAKWYTPNGVNINKNGIVPDKEVTITQADIDSGADPQLDAALTILK